MNKLVGLMAALALVSGCGVTAEDDFRAGVPSRNGVQVKVPDSSNKLLGQTAGFYQITYGATTAINGGVLAVLDLLHNIVSQKPTSKSGNTYVWGPGAPNGLEPNVWKLSVTDNKNGTYSYQLEGKKKGDPDSAFAVILSGSHTPVKVAGKNDPGHGNGTFLLDWNARNGLNNPDNQVGTADVTYDNRDDNAKVDVQFHQIKNDAGQLTDATYHYAQPSGGDGKFQFVSTKDLNGDGAAETLTIESRWKQDGTGRSDVKVSGGGLGSNSVTANECWDTLFKETYYHDSASLQPDQGQGQNPESACAFTPAEYYSGS